MIKKYFIAIFLTFNCFSQNNKIPRFKTINLCNYIDYDKDIFSGKQPIGYPSSKNNNFPKIKDNTYYNERWISKKMELNLFDPKTNKPIEKITSHAIFKIFMPTNFQMQLDINFACSICNFFTEIPQLKKTIFEYLLESDDSNMGIFEKINHIEQGDYNPIFYFIEYLYIKDWMYKKLISSFHFQCRKLRRFDDKKSIINRFKSERENKNFLFIKNKHGITPLMSLAMSKEVDCSDLVGLYNKIPSKKCSLMENDNGNNILHCFANNPNTDASSLIQIFNNCFIEKNLSALLIKKNKNNETPLDVWYSNNLTSFSNIFNKNTNQNIRNFIFNKNNIAKMDEYLYQHCCLNSEHLKNKDIPLFYHRVFDHTIDKKDSVFTYQHSIGWIERVLEKISKEQINSSDSRGVTFTHNLIKKIVFINRNHSNVFMKKFIEEHITKEHLDKQDLEGRSAFSMLFKNKYLSSANDVHVCDWIKLFLEKDPNIYIKNKKGNTPIHGMLYLILKNRKLSVTIDEDIANNSKINTSNNTSALKEKNYTLEIKEWLHGTTAIKSFCFTKFKDIYTIKNSRQQNPIEYALIKNALWSKKNSSKFLLYLFMNNNRFHKIKEIYKNIIKQHINNKDQGKKQELWMNQFKKHLNPEIIKRYNYFHENINNDFYKKFNNEDLFDKFFDAKIEEMRNYVNNKYKFHILNIFKSGEAAKNLERRNIINGYCLPPFLRQKILNYLDCNPHLDNYIYNIVSNKDDTIIKKSFSNTVNFLKQLGMDYDPPKCLYRESHIKNISLDENYRLN